MDFYFHGVCVVGDRQYNGGGGVGKKKGRRGRGRDVYFIPDA